MLKISEVTKRYAAHTALNGVSMDVPEGSVFGLLGPNGAGKTSLIRIINQITGPDSGSVYLGNEKLNPSHIKKIGYLPEERGLYKKMEVGEQAIYLARLKGLSGQEATKKLKVWFEKFDMQTWWKKKVGDLSKGMQQKVQFVVTVVHEPDLLILDEPFTGFDPVNATLIRDELLAMNKKGTTIILSTHRMETVEALCSHIALLNRAEKILDGKVSDIRNSYRSRTYSVDFEGNGISLANSLWGGFKLIENTGMEGFSRARIQIPENSHPNELMKALVNQVQVLGMAEIIPGMNEIFIKALQSEGGNHE